MERLKYLKDVVSLRFDPARCTGCGLCQTVCPHGVFEVRDGKAAITDRDLCMECGACARNCATGAIEVKAGVGCAAAVITGAIRGTGPTCDCGGESNSSKEPCCG
jgi:ferredoxin